MTCEPPALRRCPPLKTGLYGPSHSPEASRAVVRVRTIHIFRLEPGDYALSPTAPTSTGEYSRAEDTFRQKCLLFYNSERQHSHVGGVSPQQFEADYFNRLSGV